MLSICVVGAVWIATFTVDLFGLGGAPWYGWWDVVYAPAGQPYSMVFAPPAADGATAKAGIRAGDTLDLREQSLDARLDLAFQPIAGVPIPLVIHRGANRLNVRVAPSTTWQGDVRLKAGQYVAFIVAGLLLIACAFIISYRRAELVEARVLALFLVFSSLGVMGWTVPSAMGTALLSLAGYVTTPVGGAFLVALSSRFGKRGAGRKALEALAYLAIALIPLQDVAFMYAITTLRFDPIPIGIINFSYGAIVPTIINIAALSAVLLVVSVAVATTPATERPRAGWLLLPLPLAQAAAALFFSVLTNMATTWAMVSTELLLGALCLVIGALAVTYALLRRRVIDFEFVISRTVVVTTVSLIVVAAFTLLEWLLGGVLAGVGRTAGVVANAALALVLGLSLRYIHRRVDAFVDATLFRKRHEDERALLAFAKEAAYVTDADALLDRAISDIHEHTDARSAVLYVDGAGCYRPARSYGDGTAAAIGENDGAILALKTWHKPLDPHHHPTSLKGDLALPLLGRGRLLGTLVLGERRGGEAYAADEIAALSEFAHGIGSALDALDTSRSLTVAGDSTKLETTLDKVQSLLERIDARLTN